MARRLCFCRVARCRHADRADCHLRQVELGPPLHRRQCGTGGCSDEGGRNRRWPRRSSAGVRVAPGLSLHEVLLVTRQLGADIDAIVDGLLQTVVEPPTTDRRQELRDLVTVVAAARRDHAAEIVVGAVYHIRHLCQAVPYQTMEEHLLQTWMRSGQENAAAWHIDEDLFARLSRPCGVPDRFLPPEPPTTRV